MDRTPNGGARRAVRARGDHGFTIVESLTAATILLVIAIGVITVLVTTSSWYAKARLRTQAYAVANQVMANILSRNYSEIDFSSTGQSYPVGLSPSMPWPATGEAQFTVKTSMETTTDAKTGLEVKLIAVSALPVNQSLDPTVTVSRYASGWQQMAADTEKFPVTVKVQVVPKELGGANVPPWDQARVQLLDVHTLDEVYYATTDADGYATLYNVPEGQYYVTCDWQFGSNIRAMYFPALIAPTHGGSKSNPINTVNSYTVFVTKSAVGAVLRVGAYEGFGWTVDPNSGQPLQPEVPYRLVPDLWVYATPVLNTGTAQENAYFGMGGAPLYADESKLPVYSARVNAYGVAAIPIPYTIDGSTQQWHVWCEVQPVDAGGNPVGDPIPRTLTTTQSGKWTTNLQRPEGASQDQNSLGYSFGSIAQFENLGTGVRAVKDPPRPLEFP